MSRASDESIDPGESSCDRPCQAIDSLRRPHLAVQSGLEAALNAANMTAEQKAQLSDVAKDLDSLVLRKQYGRGVR